MLNGAFQDIAARRKTIVISIMDLNVVQFSGSTNSYYTQVFNSQIKNRAEVKKVVTSISYLLFNFIDYTGPLQDRPGNAPEVTHVMNLGNEHGTSLLSGRVALTTEHRRVPKTVATFEIMVSLGENPINLLLINSYKIL